MSSSPTATTSALHLLRRRGPVRDMALVSFVDSAGTGLLIPTLVLYFTQQVGLGAGTVALGLTLGGIAGLLVSVPLGHLADVRGARDVVLVLQVVQAAVIALYVVADVAPVFVLVAVAARTLSGALSSVWPGLVARTLPAEDRVTGRALLSAVFNAGAAIGAALAVVGIALDTADAYQTIIVLDALSFLGAAALTLRLPRTPAAPSGPAGGPALVVLRDRPFLLAVGLIGLLSIHNSMLDVGLPLWVSRHTAAPNAMVGVIFVVNCLVVTTASVRVARGIDTLADAARGLLRCGAVLLIACVLMALSAEPPAAIAAVLLVAGMLFQVLGEMLEGLSQWVATLELAPPDRQGQYQAAGSTTVALGHTFGPLVMVAVTDAGPAGWLVFGALIALLGALIGPAIAHAERTRPQHV